MPALQFALTYPCKATLEPLFLPKALIWNLAGKLRQAAGFHDLKIQAEDLKAAFTQLKVNGLPFEVVWELDDRMRFASEPIFGTCMTLDVGQAQVLINVAGNTSSSHKASTAAHELGHAIFDMPAVLGGGALPTTFHRTSSIAHPTQQCAAEWRANEFMGAFLLPKPMLQQALRDFGHLCGVPISLSKGGMIDTDQVMPEAISLLCEELAYAFGVSQTMIDIRLRAYGLCDRDPKTIKGQAWASKRIKGA